MAQQVTVSFWTWLPEFGSQIPRWKKTESHTVSLDPYKSTLAEVQTHTHRGEKKRLIIIIIFLKWLLVKLSISMHFNKIKFAMIKFIFLYANHVDLPKCYITYFSCCCYKIPHKINLRKERRFFLIVIVLVSSQFEGSGRSVRELVTLHLLRMLVLHLLSASSLCLVWDPSSCRHCHTQPHCSLKLRWKCIINTTMDLLSWWF